MVKNFVTDEDLKTYYPRMDKIYPSGETSHEKSRMQAFDLLLDDLRFRDIDARRLHHPIDLNYLATSTDAHINMLPFTKTATYTSEYVKGLQGFKRFVVMITSATTPTVISYNIKFQGSNDDDLAEANWEDIGDYDLTATGQTTVVMQTEYFYYRYVLTIDAGGSITYTVGLYETYIDRLIVLKAFQLIFNNLRAERGDVWDMRYEQAVTDYEMVMETAKYHVDTDEDTVPDETEDTGTGEIRFMR